MVIPVVLLYRSSWETDSSYSDKVLECEGNSGEFVELVPQQLNYLGPKDLTQYFIRSTHCHTWKSSLRFGDNFAKDCLLTLVKSRLALGSPGWLLGCHHAENGRKHRKIAVDCALMIKSKGETLSQTRPHLGRCIPGISVLCVL